MLRESQFPMKRPTAAAGGLYLALAATLLAIGATGGVLLASRPPEALSTPTLPDSVPVVSEPFRDPHDVQLRITYRSFDLSVGFEGRVTRLSCRPGVAWKSGGTPLSVDGRAVYAIATATPLWRSLTEGDRGPDVVAIQRELRHFDLGLAVTGVIDTPTLEAWSAVLRLSDRTRAIDPTTVIWLPQRSTSVSQCNVGLGTVVSSNESVATSNAQVESVQVSSTPTQHLPGDRLLLVGGVEIAVGRDGVSSDESKFEALAQDPAVRAADDGSGTISVGATWQLAQSVPVAAVPPTSLIDPATASPCVEDGSGAAIPVDILSSRAGRAIVQIRMQPWPQSVRVYPSLTRCS